MKRMMLICFAVILLMPITVTADHSVLPAPGLMDETQALDTAVSQLCEKHGRNEEEIRGKWYYEALYYPNSSWKGYTVPCWSMNIHAPQGKPDGTLISYHFDIDAGSGEILEEEMGDFGWLESDLVDCRLIPGKDQLQPADAIACARVMIQGTLGWTDEAMEDAWQDYWMMGWNENGEHWYYVCVDTPPLWDHCWEVILDVDTGSVIWHTDPGRYAARLAIEESGVSYEEWYHEQVTAYTAEWGDDQTWDYEQRAAFEEHCHGTPEDPDPHYGLPGEEDCSLGEALNAIEQYLAQWAAPGVDQEAWMLAGSGFCVDYDGRDYSIPGKGNGIHVWELLLHWPQSGDTALMTVDAATVRILGDEPMESVSPDPQEDEQGFRSAVSIQETPVPEAPEEDSGPYVYYNPEGGRCYHADQYCASVSDRYLPLTPILMDESDIIFSKLYPCPICSFPQGME